MKYPFLCCDQLTSILIWDYYGYWNENCELPFWVTDENRKKVSFLVNNLSSADLQISIKFHSNGASWCIYDPKNPHIEEYTGAVGGCSTEASARRYAENNFQKLKRLYDGDIEALLLYKKTGIPSLPNWNTNESDSWGYKNGQMNRVFRCSEIAKIKTLSQWNESKRDLSDFLSIGDLVSEDIADYFLSVLPPVTWTKNAIQLGEPSNFNASGKLTFLTLEKTDSVLWRYTGIKEKIKT